MKTTRLALTLAASLASSLVHAAVAPYTADANTLHLYHLNEAAGGSVTANVGSVGGNAYAVVNATTGNGTAVPATTTAVLGTAGATGFGNAASLVTAGHMIGFDGNASGAFQGDVAAGTFSPDAVALSTLGLTGTTAPFTLEAVVKFNGATGNREIICTDSSATSRGFQFRLNTSQQLEFNLITGGGSKFFAVPVTGTHAFATGTWFHVAVAFDGTNLNFYWTKVDPTVTSANLLGSVAYPITGTPGTITGPLILGNENRASSAELLTGAIDEVRISNIARTASQFIFSPNTAPTVSWNVDGNGDWDTPASNWTTSTVPNVAQAIANFGGVGGVASYTVSPTITLTGARTVGVLVFDEAFAHSFTLTGAGSLTLSNGASPAAINVNNGSHAINVPVSIPAAGAAISVTAPGDTLTLGAAVSGSALTKASSGKLLLSGAASASSYTVSDGTLEVGAGGSLGAGAVTLSGGTLSFNDAGTLTPANVISGTSGTIAQNGTGILTLGSNVTFGGLLGLAVNSGTVDLNGNAFSLSSLSSTTVGSVLTDSSGGVGTTTVTVGGTAATDFYGQLADGIDKKLALTKNNSGTIRFRSPSAARTGGTALNQGVLELYASNALGSGPVAMTAGVGLVSRIHLADGVAFANPVTIDVANPNGGNSGCIMAIGTATATVSGPITINNYPLAGGHFDGSDTAAGSLNLNGPITSAVANGVILRSGFFSISGGGSYPRLDVRADTTKLGAVNGIATNAVVDLGGNAAATLDLNGFNQTLAGLTFGTTVTTPSTANAATVTNFSGTLSTLTLAPVASVLFGGSITGNLNLSVTTANTVTLTKTGANVLNGLFTHTGTTTVDTGTLTLAAGITLPATTALILQNTGTLDASASGLTIAPTQSLSGVGNVVCPALQIDGSVSPGVSGLGTLGVTGNTALGAAAVTNLEIGGAASNDHLNVSGNLVLDGTVNVSLINAFAPSAGQSFDLLNSLGAIDVTNFDINTDLVLPALGSGLAWDRSEFASDGVVSVVTSTPYAGWQSAKFSPSELSNPLISGDNADPDGDGLSNALEYAFGTEPKATSPGFLPQSTTTAGQLVLTYLRPVGGVSGVTYSIQTNTDLQAGGAGWTFATPVTDYAQGTSTVGVPPGYEKVTVTFGTAVGAGQRKFSRVFASF